MTDWYSIAQVRQDALAVKNEELKRLKTKLERCQEKLAAAEARVKRALEVLSRIPPDSPIHGKDMRILRKSETAALDAALEQAYQEGVETKISKLLEDKQWLERVMENWNWPNEWIVATRLKKERDRAQQHVRNCQEFIDELENEHEAALEQARVQELKKWHKVVNHYWCHWYRKPAMVVLGKINTEMEDAIQEIDDTYFVP